MKSFLLTAISFFMTVSVFNIRSDSVCRMRQLRCEDRCAQDNKVGSMAHLKCNDRCREDYYYCRQEDGF